MRLDDLKKEMPETPEFIHNMIQHEVEKQLKEEKVVPFSGKKNKRWKAGQVAAAALVCVLVSSTVAYAGNKLYHLYQEKQGTYSVATGVRSEEEKEKVKVPDQVHEITITANYIPEGMEWNDEHKVKLSYKETPNQGGITLDSVLLDERDLSEVQVDTGVVESEERTFGTYAGVYLRYQDLKEDRSFNQRIYLLCPEEYRMIILYIGDDVAKEEAVKFAENLSVTEKEQMIATKDMYTWSQFVHPEESSGNEEYVTEVADSKLPVYKVGQSLKLDAYAEDENGVEIENQQIMATVDRVQITDDLSLLEGKDYPEEWKHAVGSDGKLVKNHLSYIQSGDGVETLDQVVKEEDVDQKLVYVTVTYTNSSDVDMEQVHYMGVLMLMEHTNGTYQVYDMEEQPGKDYDKVTGSSEGRNGDMSYFSEKNAGEKNYIPALKAGQSTQVVMAWIVNEPDLKNMYLNLNSSGNAYCIDSEDLKTGVVSIGK